MRPLAHHATEETLAPLLLLGGTWLTLLLTAGRHRLAALRGRLTGKDGSRRRGRDAGQEPPGHPGRHGGSVEP